MSERTVFQSMSHKHVVSLGPKANVWEAACVMTRANCGTDRGHHRPAARHRHRARPDDAGAGQGVATRGDVGVGHHDKKSLLRYAGYAGVGSCFDHDRAWIQAFADHDNKRNSRLKNSRRIFGT